MKSLKATIAIVAVSLMSVSCGGSPESVAGATSETTNGIALTVVNESGSGVAKASVYLAKSGDLRTVSDKDRAPTTLTDKSGNFKIDSLDTVDYIIEIVDSLGNRAMSNSIFNKETKKHTIIGNQKITLSQTGRLFGTIEKLPSQNVSIQIYGLHRVTRADSTGYFSFTDLPAGDIRIKISMDTKTIAEDKFIVQTKKITDAGTFIIGTTDSSIVRYILSINGDTTTKVSDVYRKVSNGYVLNLDNKNITILPPEIGKLRLVELSLASNKLTSIPKEVFNLTQLYYIDLSNNQLTELPESISRLEHCETIDIESNKLTTLPASISNMDWVENIHLNQNYLHNLPDYLREWINAHCPDKSWMYKQVKSTKYDK